MGAASGIRYHGHKATLTEAGWCEKCKDNWDDEKSGCKEIKKKKEDGCNHASLDSDDTTSTPTSSPVEDESSTTGNDDSNKALRDFSFDMSTLQRVELRSRGLRGVK